MKNNPKLPLAFSVVFLLCTAFHCGVEQEEPAYTHRFAESVDLFPAQKSYRVGDTLWVQYVNPEQELFEATINQRVPAKDVSIDFEIFFNSRYQTPSNPLDGFCDFVTDKGVHIPRPTSHYGINLYQTFGCSPAGFDFKVGIVPKYAGIYSLELRHMGPPAQVRDCPDSPSPYPLSSIDYTFNLADLNKDVYLSIPPRARAESAGGFSESLLDSKKVFVVKVE